MRLGNISIERKYHPLEHWAKGRWNEKEKTHSEFLLLYATGLQRAIKENTFDRIERREASC